MVEQRGLLDAGLGFHSLRIGSCSALKPCSHWGGRGWSGSDQIGLSADQPLLAGRAGRQMVEIYISPIESIDSDKVNRQSVRF